jgi:hypothetical protein
MSCGDRVAERFVSGRPFINRPDGRREEFCEFISRSTHPSSLGQEIQCGTNTRWQWTALTDLDRMKSLSFARIQMAKYWLKPPGREVEDALRRLQTDYIDLLQLRAFDAGTAVERVLSTLDTLVRASKVRYIGVSNSAGWEIMKSLAVAERHGWPRYVANQVYYSLVGRD